MRILIVVLTLVCSVTCAFAAEPDVRAERHGKVVYFADGGALASDVLALVESCSTNSTTAAEYAVPRDGWERAMASGSFIHVVFQEPRTVSLLEPENLARTRQPVHEILLPLPEDAWPLHIFIKNDKGTFSFTKYDPLMLRQVLLVQQLDLQDTEPYKTLLKPPAKP